MSSSMDPQGQNQPPYDPTSAQGQGGAPYGAVPGQQPAPEAPKKRGKGKFIALGCGILALLVILLIGGCTAIVAMSGDDDSSETTATEEATEQDEEAAADEEAPAKEEAPAEEDEAAEEPAEESDVPADHASALTQAQSYSDTMYMSKQGIFDQLISEYGDQFTEDQAQYAIDNIDADWNENALESARVYQEEMAMSPDAIHDQLISEYGDQFTEEQANYAIDNLES